MWKKKSPTPPSLSDLTAHHNNLRGLCKVLATEEAVLQNHILEAQAELAKVRTLISVYSSAVEALDKTIESGYNDNVSKALDIMEGEIDKEVKALQITGDEITTSKEAEGHDD